MRPIRLDRRVRKLATNQTLGIKHRVGGIHRCLVLGGIANESFGIVEGHIGWGCAIALVIGNDFNTVILPDADTRIGCAQVNANGFAGDGCGRGGHE